MTTPQGDREETKEEARIRENQRRCRGRRLAYINSLEERIRGYEQEAMNANIHLQNLAKRLDAENRKMKNSLVQAHGLAGGEDMDTDILIEKVTAQKSIRGNASRTILPLTPPAENRSAGELTVALRPSTGNNQVRPELQVIPSAENYGDVTVPCYVSYELLKSLIDEQDPLAAEIRALELRNGGIL